MSERMHETHDLDLLAALVERRLSDPTPAEALVRSCPECARIVAEHRLVLSQVQAEPAASMTELERRRLHTSIWAALEGERDVTRAPAPSATRTPWWYRLAPVAAALVVVVGIMNLNLGQGDSAATTTVAQSLSAPEPDALAPVAGASPGQEEFAATTAAGAMDTAATDTTVATESLRWADAENLADEASEFEERAAEVPGDLPEAALECVDADSPTGDPIAAERLSLADRDVWLVAFGRGSDVASVRAYDADTCELLYPIE